MQAIAHLRYLRMSPRKVRLVADAIRGADVPAADVQLAFLPKAASAPLRKLLASATANAIHNGGLAKENLYVRTITVNQGPTIKRFRARAFGRAASIRKRSCHVTIVLDERIPTTEGAARKHATAAAPAPTIVSERPRAAERRHAHHEDRNAVAPAAGTAEQVAEGQEIFDVRRKGKHRSAQHEDARSGKRAGGFFKKLFNRRSGER